MAKRPKVKKYLSKTSFYASNKRKKLVRNILFIILILALIFVGISSYPIIKKALTGDIKPNPVPEIANTPSANTTPTVEKNTAEVIDEAAPEISESMEIKAITIPYDVATDVQKTQEFLSGLSSDVNVVLVEIKDNLGKVKYITDNPDVIAWQSAGGNINLSELSKAIADKGYRFGIELSVFSDPVAAKGNLDANAIMHSSGVIWLDNSLSSGGKAWVTPYSERARKYNIALVEEAVNSGAEIVLVNHVNFPNDPTDSANVKAVDGVSKSDVLNLFYSELQETVGEDVTIIASISYLDLIGDNSQALYGGDPFELNQNIWAVKAPEEIAAQQIIVGDKIKLIPIISSTDEKHSEFIIK